MQGKKRIYIYPAIIALLVYAGFFIYYFSKASNLAQETNAISSSETRASSKLRVGWFTASLGQDYFKFAEAQTLEAEKYFCSDRPWVESRYFIFTDVPEIPSALAHISDRVSLIQKKKRGWPEDSELRFQWMAEVIAN